MEQTILQQIIDELINKELMMKEGKGLSGLVKLSDAIESLEKLEVKLTEQTNRDYDI